MDLSPVFYMHKCIAMAEYFPLCREKILQPLSKLLRQQFFWYFDQIQTWCFADIAHSIPL